MGSSGRRAAAKRDASSCLDRCTPPPPTKRSVSTPTLKSCNRALGIEPEDSRRGLGYDTQALCIGRHHTEAVCPSTSLSSRHPIYHLTKWPSQLQEYANSRECCLN